MKFPLKYEKGIRLVTRKRTTKEAEKAFADFIARKIREAETARGRHSGAALNQVVESNVAETLECLREKGWAEDFFEMARRDYAAMPRRAPRKKVKIVFDANGLPKMTKTPLDPQVSAVFEAAKYLRGQERALSVALKA